ncbi:thioredoxin domain-containing protein 5 homolog [Drosophila novamexicana]|uniref:thioredoxin domain-containing protein 5 homolog n=1 Tax=Drosophila novamexicana TaxID=47314 RepID=UPI0011E59A3E|nr:thioredoxin domain-containing protein 5 homolog [Drosophila novamexicana]
MLVKTCSTQLTLFILLANFSVQTKLAMGKSIVSLNPESFESASKSRTFFVEFYVPGCPSCSRLYVLLTNLLAIIENSSTSNNNNITIAAMDCGKHEKFCSAKNISSYPSLALFEKGGTRYKLFNGSAELYTLIKFLSLQNIYNYPAVRERRADTSCTPGRVLKLKSDTFRAAIASGRFFIKFYSSTCHYCKELAPIWTELAKGLTEQTLCIAEYDCVSDRSICNELNIKTVPTILWFQDGRLVQRYKGARHIDSLRTFVEEMLNGTYRSAAATLATITVNHSQTIMCTSLVFVYIYIT